jgi:ribosomal protein S18 acetylase RimI-like enzyme
MTAWRLRPATPGDAEFLGWACVAAARSQQPRGWFDIILQRDELQRDEAFIVAFAAQLTIAKARSWWHWSLFHVAEVGGVVASAMCGFGDDGLYAASRGALAEASEKMGIGIEEQAQFWQRGSFVASTFTSEPGAWTIENVATKPEFRGSGVSHALVENELAVARAAGFKRAQVSFFIGNTPAERLYAKSGFIFASEKRAADFEAAMGTPGTTRYARDL